MLQSNMAVNPQGHFVFAGFDTVELAKKYGTGLYLIDEDRIRGNCRQYVHTMRSCMPAGSVPLFASKALSFKQMLRIINEEGMCADVVSAGELYTALAADFPAERIYFHGVNKTDEDIAYALDNKVGYFIIDCYEELYALDRMAGERGIRQKALLRLTPGIDPHTFAAVNTGKVDCQFGVPIETGQAREFVSAALKAENIDLVGYHCHIGSQIFDAQPFCDAIDIMLGFISMIRDEFGYTASVLDLGGGFGVRYVESDPHVDIPACIRRVAAYLEKACIQCGLPVPVVLMEPGRSIVADAGVTLYTVGSVKEINGYRSYVTVDGGMSDNPRYALYGSEYTAIIANKADQPADYLCSIAGRCCESGALIQENIMLQQPERGDTLAVMVTGAYNYSMASNYNRLRRLPIVMLHEGKDYLAVRRETFADLLSCDL
ncbi:MAG: diaminopimelate decarboxylase [Ruminococcaceae bacterium]|nr:diaminopimelate decarboxylase [Oscillospiraceae bacterium]